MVVDALDETRSEISWYHDMQNGTDVEQADFQLFSNCKPFWILPALSKLIRGDPEVPINFSQLICQKCTISVYPG